MKAILIILLVTASAQAGLFHGLVSASLEPPGHASVEMRDFFYDDATGEIRGGNVTVYPFPGCTGCEIRNPRIEETQGGWVIMQWPFVGRADPITQTVEFTSKGITDYGEIQLFSVSPREITIGWQPPFTEPIEHSAITFYPPGDANTDGFFDSSDLVGIMAGGAYEAHMLAGWTQGDFNFDEVSNSSDLVVALAYGNYEGGAFASVPEPCACVLVLIGFLLLALYARRIG